MKKRMLFTAAALACAAAYATLSTLKSENIVPKVKEKGEYFLGKLKELQAKYPEKIKEVRGRGLLVGFEVTKPGAPIVASCLEQGVIINCTVGNVIRMVPPLIVSKEEIDTVLAALDKALEKF